MDTSLTPTTWIPLPSASAPVQKMSAEKLNCPLCWFAFDTEQAVCSGCPVFGGCAMLKCPNCNYEFVVESKIWNWFSKLFRRKGI